MADKLFDLPDGGYIGRYDANEIEIVPGHKDPCKIRFAVPQEYIDQGLTNLGAFSGNIKRGDGRHDEKALVMLRLNGPREAQCGAVYIATAPPGSDKVQERFYIDHQQAIFRVPIIAPNLTSQIPGRFYTGDGRYCYNVQGDPTPEFPHGRIVQYDTHGSTDESTWTAVAILRPEKI